MNEMMKRIMYLCVLALSLVGCNKDTKETPAEVASEYYVKYVFSCKIIQYGKAYSTDYSVTFIDSGLQEQTRKYKTVDEEELICGPFKYGDKMSISLKHYYSDNAGGSSTAQTLLDVYVSKNNSPFALRKSESSSSQRPNTTSLEYVIDY